MAGEWLQEARHSHGNDPISLKEREELRLGGAGQARKRQPELLPGGRKWKRQGIRIEEWD
jgi:hypothetical protein